MATSVLLRCKEKTSLLQDDRRFFSMLVDGFRILISKGSPEHLDEIIESLGSLLQTQLADHSGMVMVLQATKNYFSNSPNRSRLLSTEPKKAMWSNLLGKFLVSPHWELRDSSLEVIVGICEGDLQPSDKRFLLDSDLLKVVLERAEDEEAFVRATFLGVIGTLLTQPEKASVLREVKPDEAVWELTFEILADSEAVVRRAAIPVLEHTLLLGYQSHAFGEWSDTSFFLLFFLYFFKILFFFFSLFLSREPLFHRLAQDPDWEVQVRFVRVLETLYFRVPLIFHRGRGGALLIQLLEESEHRVSEAVVLSLTHIQGHLRTETETARGGGGQLQEFEQKVLGLDLTQLELDLKGEETLPERIDFDDIFSHIHVCDNTLDCY